MIINSDCIESYSWEWERKPKVVGYDLKVKTQLKIKFKFNLVEIGFNLDMMIWLKMVKLYLDLSCIVGNW